MNIDIKIKECILGSMTNVIELSDIKHYKSLDKVPEVLRLAAWVSSNNDGECLINSNKIKDDIDKRHCSYDPRYERNRRETCHQKRLIDVKHAFKKVCDFHQKRCGKFNQSTVDVTKSFFETAFSAGYTTKRELSEFLEIKNPDDLDYLASWAREQRIHIEGIIGLGKIRKREQLSDEVTPPSPTPHVVGRAPR